MLVIRLIKIGKKNNPSFRVIVTEKTAASQSGNFLEILGSYNPSLIIKGKKFIQLKADRIKYWLSRGAQPSVTVHNLLVNEGVIDAPKLKKKIKPKKKKDKDSEKLEEKEVTPKEKETDTKEEEPIPQKEETDTKEEKKVVPKEEETEEKKPKE